MWSRSPFLDWGHWLRVFPPVCGVLEHVPTGARYNGQRKVIIDPVVFGINIIVIWVERTG